jgi:hypothetical protein
MFGAIGDGFTSGWGLLKLLGANNNFAIVMALIGGFIVTFFAVASDSIVKNWRSMPSIILFLWLIAFLLDVYTAIFTTINQMILNNDSGNLIYLSQVTFEPNNAGRTVLAFSLAFLVNGSSVAFGVIFQKMRQP